MDLDELKGYGIAEQLARVVEEGFSFNEETGEVYFTTDDLDALNMAFEEKIDSLSGLYELYGDRAKSLKERSKDISEKAKRFENKSESIKKYIDSLMKIAEKTKIEVGDKSLSYRKSVSSEVYDEKALREYIEQDEERMAAYYKESIPDIKKKEIGDAIKATKEVDEDGNTTYSLTIPGFRLVENNNLQIK